MICQRVFSLPCWYYMHTIGSIVYSYEVACYRQWKEIAWYWNCPWIYFEGVYILIWGETAIITIISFKHLIFCNRFYYHASLLLNKCPLPAYWIWFCNLYMNIWRICRAYYPIGGTFNWWHGSACISSWY